MGEFDDMNNINWDAVPLNGKHDYESVLPMLLTEYQGNDYAQNWIHRLDREFDHPGPVAPLVVEALNHAGGPLGRGHVKKVIVDSVPYLRQFRTAKGLEYLKVVMGEILDTLIAIAHLES